jgi:hypothetical protein
MSPESALITQLTQDLPSIPMAASLFESSSRAPSVTTIQASRPQCIRVLSGACSAVFHPPWPNHRFEGTAEKLRFSVPRRLRRRAAPQAER